MATLPAARVVRDKPWPATNVLAAAPRSVPVRLWIRIAFGGLIAPVGWFAIALMTWIMVIVGMRFDANKDPSDDLPLPWVIAIVVLSAAPVLAVAGWRARKHLHMLRHGVETRGKLLHKREVEGAEDSAWHYTFEYTVENGSKQQVTVITDTPEKLLEDDALEAMVYDPSGRRDAITLDHLPGYPQIDEQGNLVVRNPRVWPVLILPVVAVAGVIAAFATL